MKKTNTTLAILTAGIMIASCQSNNKPVAQTTPAVVCPEPVAVAAPATPEVITTTDNSTASIAPAVCVTPAAPMRHRTAYRPKKKVTTTTTVVTTTPYIYDQSVVRVSEPEPVVPATPAPSTEPVYTYEKPADFTGFAPAAPAKRSKIHLAPEAGGTLNNFYKLEHNYQTSNMLKVGGQAGVMVNIELGKRLSLEPGLRYIMKGGEITSTTHDAGYPIEHKDKLTFHYVEMPVNLIYSTGDWGTSRFMIGAGPYVAGLASAGAKTKDKEFRPDGIVVKEGSRKVQTGDPDNAGNVRRYDAGAGAFIGYQDKSGVYTKAGAEFGLLDLQKGQNTLGGFYDRNYNFLLSVGYMFGYKK